MRLTLLHKCMSTPADINSFTTSGLFPSHARFNAVSPSYIEITNRNTFNN